MLGKMYGAIEKVTHSKGYSVARSDPCVPLKVSFIYLNMDPNLDTSFL
jgi:hypothetical protein